ncbi:E3 ubiquitin-protein ligase TRIM69, partial [Austrofundulus limnaeus]|uniref:E3 ubiquitin-protein ligase TRIM69 n=1 Tax=Austrofundulus limnaeus TaxID=52670 RepID=A0A2I4AIG1_AUSLI
KRVNELENELENIKIQIEQKTDQVTIPGIRIANLSAEILELQSKIQPLEEELSDLKETYETNLAELQERLNTATIQLQDDELLLKQSNSRIFDLLTQISDLKTQLKNAKKQASKPATQSIADLEEKLKTQQRESKKLESANKNLKQEVEALRARCPVNADCGDLQRQLQQSQKDADYYHKLTQEKENALKNLRHNFDALAQEKTRLQQDYDNLLKKQINLEDQTIQTSLMTMDPNTANPRIVLSADGTQVSTTDSPLQVQDSPGRFDVSLAVLGSTGYSSGRHYWEVNVAGKSCFHIGMASQSSTRKGLLSFNPTRGFWTVVLNKQGELRALDKRPATIRARTPTLTLGILLDYKKGQISFYDAGTRSHLYTFSGQAFTDKIYPFINYCVEDGANPTPIVLVQPGSTDWIK